LESFRSREPAITSNTVIGNKALGNKDNKRKRQNVYLGCNNLDCEVRMMKRKGGNGKKKEN